MNAYASAFGLFIALSIIKVDLWAAANFSLALLNALLYLRK